MNKYDIAIIGAGPAGIMAAITASDGGRNKIVLLEKNEFIGRKILATGNGRCNLTNVSVIESNYHGGYPSIAYGIIRKFDQQKTIELFNKFGLLTKVEERGRVFPITNQATSVVEILKHKLEENNVVVLTNFEVKKIQNTGKWQLVSDDGKEVIATKVIITTGGKAAHQFGSSGDGIFWAKNLGHKVEEISAALVPINTVDGWPKQVQGLKVSGVVGTLVDGKIVQEKSGDILFTHYGLSGPAILGSARLIGKALGEKKKVIVQIDLFKEASFNDLERNVEAILSVKSKKSIKNSLIGLIPQNLIPIILDLAKIDETKKSAEISKKERQRLVDTLKCLELQVDSLRPLKEAQVTAGGISLRDINPDTMESKIIKNLYFAGEVLDVDADSGGFNLQWAWSSGYLAGKSASTLLD